MRQPFRFSWSDLRTFRARGGRRYASHCRLQEQQASRLLRKSTLQKRKTFVFCTWWWWASPCPFLLVSRSRERAVFVGFAPILFLCDWLCCVFPFVFFFCELVVWGYLNLCRFSLGATVPLRFGAANLSLLLHFAFLSVSEGVGCVGLWEFPVFPAPFALFPRAFVPVTWGFHLKWAAFSTKSKKKRKKTHLLLFFLLNFSSVFFSLEMHPIVDFSESSGNNVSNRRKLPISNSTHFSCFNINAFRIFSSAFNRVFARFRYFCRTWKKKQ